MINCYIYKSTTTLTVVMIITSLPMTVFGSTQRITHPTNSEALTLFYERGMVSGSGGGITDEGFSAVESWIEGTNLVIELSGNVEAGRQFQLHLEGGAQWFFRQRDSARVTAFGPVSTILPTRAADVTPAVGGNGLNVPSFGRVALPAHLNSVPFNPAGTLSHTYV